MSPSSSANTLHIPFIFVASSNKNKLMVYVCITIYLLRTSETSGQPATIQFGSYCMLRACRLLLFLYPIVSRINNPSCRSLLPSKIISFNDVSVLRRPKTQPSSRSTINTDCVQRSRKKEYQVPLM